MVLKSLPVVRVADECFVMRCSLISLLVLVASIMWAGCSKPSSATSSAGPPKSGEPPKLAEVKFVHPIVQKVAPYEEFGGRTAAEKMVELRSRVSGYLAKVGFDDGDDVRVDDVLFEIDDAIFQANLAQADATVHQRQAEVSRLKAQLVRAKRLVLSQAATEQEVENLTFETAAAEAVQLAAEAARERARLDTRFAKIQAPIDGRIGRRLVDPGNLVLADDTSLAMIVSHDPIHAYFDYDERSILAMRRLVEEGKLKEAPDRSQPVQVALAGEDKYGITGTINWIDNQIDMNTGTLRARIEIANPKRLLSPGMFVRLRVPLGPEENAILIPEEALVADQGQRFVYIINAKDEIEYRRVDIGWLTEEGKRVVRKGLGTSDRVVVTGLQRIRLPKPDPNSKKPPEPLKVDPQPWIPPTSADAATTKPSTAEAATTRSN